ncbi:XdhC family protein [Zavarzinia sp. CC-PAN008]|uniref:XdhC family protein n=1 Tax=Zavarzinia sp. CC-PAN008 TaxID=3243332 RepID=UPI003F74333E
MKAETLERLTAARAQKRAIVLATHLTSGDERLIGPDDRTDPLYEQAMAALRDDRSQPVETADGTWFLNAFNPPLRLVIIGAVHIAQPLIALARIAGYEPIVVDPRRAFASPERFPGIRLSNDWPDEALAALDLDARTAVVALTHDPKLDDPGLRLAISSPAFYVGALGSRKTHERRCQRLREAGATNDEIARIRGPIGLAIGAKTPAEIGVSILAEMTGFLRGTHS